MYIQLNIENSDKMTLHVTYTLRTRYTTRYTWDIIEYIGKMTRYTRYTTF